METQKTRLLIPIEDGGSQPGNIPATQSMAAKEAETDYKDLPFTENCLCSNPTCRDLIIPSTCEERVRISPDTVITVTTCPNCERKYRLT
jgi:hypothetical protein